MQLGKLRSSELSICKVQRVKVCKMPSLGTIFMLMAKGSTLLGQRTLSLPSFKLWQNIHQKGGHEVYVSVYSASRIAEEKLICFYCHLSGTFILTLALTWKVSSGMIQFRQQKVAWLEREAVTYLPAFGFQTPPSPSAVVSGYPCSSCCWPSTTRCGRLCHVLEAKNLNEDSTLPWKVIHSPFRWQQSLTAS